MIAPNNSNTTTNINYTTYNNSLNQSQMQRDSPVKIKSNLSAEQRELEELTEIHDNLGRHTAQFIAEKVYMVEKRRQASAINVPVKQKDFQLIRNTKEPEAHGQVTKVITGESIRDRDLKGKTTTFNKTQFSQINTIERMHRFLESQFVKEKSKNHITIMPNGRNGIVREKVVLPGSRGKPPPAAKYTPCKCNCPHDHSPINSKAQNVYTMNNNGTKGPMDNPAPGPVEIFREKQYLCYS
jgi:hypothetical protein